jgi:hypothetical protein
MCLSSLSSQTRRPTRSKKFLCDFVQAHCAIEHRWGEGDVYVHKQSSELSHHDIRGLQAARDHAHRIGRPLNTHVCWRQYPGVMPDPAARSRDTNRFFTHLRTWTRRHTGRPFTALWVWHSDEDGSGRNPHLHVLMHLPARLREELHCALQAKYAAGAIDVRDGTYISVPHPSGYWGSTFGYITRHMSQQAFVMLSGKSWRASRRDPNSGKHVGIKTPILGKRWGCTRNISPKAVEAHLAAQSAERELARRAA